MSLISLFSISFTCVSFTSRPGSNFVVVAYNDLGQSRQEWVRLPVASGRQISVFDGSGAGVNVSLVPVPGQTSIATAVFPLTVPAMGHATAFVVFSTQRAGLQAPRFQPPVGDTVVVENAAYMLTFDTASGLLQTIGDRRGSTATRITQTWGWYNASDGNVPENQNRGQASGAYIFRPNCTENVPTACRPFNVASGPVSLSVIRTPHVQEVHQVFAPWLTQVVRLYQTSDAIEVEYTVGPIPFQDGLGKEIVSVWSTGM